MSDQYSLMDREDAVTLRDAWEQVLSEVRPELPDTAFEKFLSPLTPAETEGTTVILDAPGSFVAEWVRQKYAELLEAKLSEQLGRSIKLNIRIQQRGKPEPTKAEVGVISRQPITVEPKPAFKPSERYRFDTFVVGQSNRLAHAGAKAVASAPGVRYNPFFIYGSCGLGKTHLLHSIAHEIHRHNAQAHVVYMTGQQFAEEFVHALQSNRIEAFRKAQRGVQVWLLDDVQFIAGKERTQEEVFHTFNYLHSLGKQIVLCSDRPPRDLLLMDERLRSRFEMGLVADVQMPDTECRCAILQSKAKQDRIQLDHEVAMYLAESVHSNVRILEGALIKIATEASLDGGRITLGLAEAVVEKYYRNIGAAKPSFDQILDSVSKHYKIPPSDIKGSSRKAPIAHARHVAVYVTREITGDSWKHIGALFGNRDHTSVMHGYRKIREMMNRDKELNASVQLLINNLFPEI
ncbi:MAG: chromosomal replication initiator protein DnaA [Fimbriimonadaceae bacterium]|nr:chromosomal replication initiator protein DnaA [Fimbriimonadaceae bacterium]QYK56153.1 MAG: chromosomal replication initiator protein DnaA [Fimbriimonadaceae bacterium]